MQLFGDEVVERVDSTVAPDGSGRTGVGNSVGNTATLVVVPPPPLSLLLPLPFVVVDVALMDCVLVGELVIAIVLLDVTLVVVGNVEGLGTAVCGGDVVGVDVGKFVNVVDWDAVIDVVGELVVGTVG